MKASQVLGIIVSVALIIFSAAYPVPEKYVNVRSSAYDSSWGDNVGAYYIGGDAYNYQIEASLKAGYLSGILAIKAIAFVGGLLLFFLTLYSQMKCAALNEQAGRFYYQWEATAKENRKAFETIVKNAEQQKAILKALSAAVDNHFSQNHEEDMQ